MGSLRDREIELLKADENPRYNDFLENYVKKHGLPTCPEAYLHRLYLTQWKKENRPAGRCAHVLRWERQYFQLFHCQSEYIGYRFDCCESASIAVPIGCNHRLCPLCSWHRSERAQRKTKTLFSKLAHPQFLTLTVPNVKRISKRTFHIFRKRVRLFLAQHKEFIGGVYAIETTYNRTETGWHVHAHVLVDAVSALPQKDWRVEFAGRNMPAFTLIKLALEYDWSRLWIKALPKLPRVNASIMTREGERFDFEQWARDCQANALKEWRDGGWKPIRGTSQLAELKRRTDWNIGHRRVIWIKPVDDRNKAAKEVLKYITKCADFCDRRRNAWNSSTTRPKAAAPHSDLRHLVRRQLPDAPEAFDPDWLENWGRDKVCVRQKSKGSHRRLPSARCAHCNRRAFVFEARPWSQHAGHRIPPNNSSA